MSITLNLQDRLPEDLADMDVRDIGRVFPGPTLIEVEGDNTAPVYISTLLHGNETTSFQILQHLQRVLAHGRPPRSLMIFVGNVAAAAEGKRHLPDQPDFNRIWAGGDGPYHELAQQVAERARMNGIVASVDIHNNTGRNPIYGCVNTLRPQDLRLAAMFAPTAVYYLNPPTTQSISFSRFCPAITVECGQSGDPEGVAAATRLVDGVIGLERFPDSPPPPGTMDLYKTVGRILVDEAVELSFGEPGADLVLRSDLEAKNFETIEGGSVWCETTLDDVPFRVVNEHGSDLTSQFFRRDGKRLVVTEDVVPSMVTRDRDIIRQDCLCYLMKPLAGA